jgi:hypothetical protein
MRSLLVRRDRGYPRFAGFNANRDTARGTSEPNYEAGGGKFGVVVGDPVVSNTTLRLPGARGYPVQVGYPTLSSLWYCSLT